MDLDPVFRSNEISYLEIPSRNIKQSVAFYRREFGWEILGDPGKPSFDDGTGHVIGHWNTDLGVVGDAGMLPFVFVKNVDNVLEKVKVSGGEEFEDPYCEGDLQVAKFRDPAGDVIGVWSCAEKT